ncbi:PAS domain S-box protein [Haloplanus rubicundus]|uniref:histidine kinase n=1 Tax=Haloplanus rubicundus TaxID=1547898 RepID=A0A345E1H1_9EURY|nr:PAS domain S-box protein [Haloplanus rubicundus]AXG06043.1 PAS domain S-box protein [Haloplanus rubicundus]
MSKRRVLYVGDGGGEAVEDRFAEAGAEGRTAATAAEALDRLSSEAIDGVVASTPLPDTDGIDLLKRVRASHPNLPFVLFPTEGSEALASEAIGAGVTDYVSGSDGDRDRLVERVLDAIEPVPDRRAERVVDLVRTVQSALVRARTAEDIDEQVCAAIVETKPYAFAWIGEYDGSDGQVTPRASAGFEAGYLESIDVTADGSRTSRGPTGRAVESRAIETVQDISTAPEYEPWRAEALERSYRSSAAIPLHHDDTLYGVLNVYADRTGAFDPKERALLADLGETIGHAYHRVRMQELYESQYRQLFEEAPVMVALTRDTDDGPTIEDCNRQFAAKLGWSREEFRGCPLTDVYTEEATRKLLDGDGYERALAGEFVTTERTLRTRNGDRLETLLQATPRRNTDGDVVGTNALFVDLTERKRAEEVIDQAEAMEASIDGIGIIDKTGEFVYANRAHADIYGYDGPEAFVGNTWRMLYEADEIERFDDEVMPALRAGEEWRGEATGVRADGSTFPQDLSLTPLSDGGYICVVRDITERKQYERRLEGQRDNLEILNQVVRHDIRNDLQVVVGYATVLREFVDDEGREHLERVIASGRDAVEITKTAADVAEVMLSATTETKAVGLRYALTDRIDEVAETHANAILTTEGTIPDVEVPADDMLGSVFKNLLTNAVVHNDGPVREVTVSVTVDDDTATVRVADNGPGIPDARKDAIFEDGEKGLDSEGTGLGLYLVETLVDRYGGDVWVEDNEPTGAVFVVELPVVG